MHDGPQPHWPPFCPNPLCTFHHHPQCWPIKRAGFYLRNSPPLRVQRFQCLHCHRFFSSQSFSPSYWLKIPNLLPILFSRSLACSALRQIANELHVAPSTVMRQIERLGRHCLLFQTLHMPDHLAEPLVIDGFETFEFSQYHPLHFNLAVGAHSHFLYAFTDAELRRKGRMKPQQKIRREWLEQTFGRPDPKAIQKEIAQLLRIVLPSGGSVEIRSDEHKAYPKAFQMVAGLFVHRHQLIPSKHPRSCWNPLFPVNLLDLLIRHCSANHKPETIAFSKRRQAAAERLAILQVWRNFMKPFSEKRNDASPAERLGVLEGKLTVEQLLRQRLFPSLVGLPERLMRYYRRDIETRRIPNGRRHRLRYAF